MAIALDPDALLLAALEVLRGRTGEVVRELTKQMERFSEALDFEKAAEARDRIAAVRHRFGELPTV